MEKSNSEHSKNKQLVKKAMYAIKVTADYTTNFIYIVLFLEKEPKHPIIKFIAAMVLLSIVALGVWQVIEARKANEIASKSLDLSNRISALSLISDDNVDDSVYVGTYNYLVSTGESFNIPIANKNIAPNEPFVFERGEKGKINIHDSDITISYKDLKYLYLGFYDSFIDFFYSDFDYVLLSAYNTTLKISSYCELNSISSKNCNAGDGYKYFDVKLRGKSSLLYYSPKNVIIDVGFLDYRCKYIYIYNIFQDPKKEESDCISDKTISFDYSPSIDEETAIKVISLLTPYDEKEKFLANLPKDEAITFYINHGDNVFVFPDYDFFFSFYNLKVNYLINESSDIFFYNYADNDAVGYFVLRDSKIKYASKYIFNSGFDVKDSSLSIISRVDDKTRNTIREEYFKRKDLACNDIIEGLFYYLKYQNNGFYTGYNCFNKLGKTSSNLEGFQDGSFEDVALKNDEIYNYLLSKDFVVLKKPKDDYEELFNLSNVKIELSGEKSSLNIDGYSIKDSSVAVGYKVNFENIRIQNSVFSEMSFLKIHFENDDIAIRCDKINTVFKNKENFKGTVIKRSNIKIIPEDACTLDEGLFN